MSKELMDVEMPDGTVIQDVPVGTTRSEIERRYGLRAKTDQLSAIRQAQAAKYPTAAERGAPAGTATVNAAPHTFLNSLPAMLGSLPGAAIGAEYGAGLGTTLGPVGTIVGGAIGGVAGAGLGAFGGETARQVTRGENLDVPRAAGEANLNMLGEGIGRTAEPLIAGGGRWIGQKAASIVGSRPVSDRVASAAALRGIPLTVAERTGSPVAAHAEAMAERSTLASPVIHDAARAQSQAAVEHWWQPEILDQIAPHMDKADVGAAVQQALGESKERVLGNVSRMFDTATEIATARNVQIPEDEIVALANQVLDSPELREAVQRVPSLADNESLRLLRQLREGVMQSGPVMETGPVGEAVSRMGEVRKTTMPYGTAEIMRKAVQKIVRDASDVGVNIGGFKRLSGVIDDTMRDSLAAQAPDAYRIWNAARELYAPAIGDLGSRGKDFGATALQALAKSHPEQVVESVMKSGLSGIETARKYLEFSPVWPQIQRQVLEDAMAKSMTGEGSKLGADVIRGQFWATQLEKNRSALQRVLSKDTLRQVDEFTDVVKRFRVADKVSGNPSGTMQAAHKLADFGAVATLADNGIRLITGQADSRDAKTAAGAATLLLGPRAIARIMVEPNGARLLTQGLQTPAATRTGAAIIGRLSAYIGYRGGQQ